MFSRTLFLSSFFIISTLQGFAQPGCPMIDVGPDQAVDCNVNCVDLTATVLETGETSTYTVSSVPYAPPSPFTGGATLFIGEDDIWGDVITLPFNFCFYGTDYSQLVIGANGLLTFDLTEAGQYCAWSYSAPCPTPGPPPGGLYNNSIMGAYQDIDPSVCFGLFNTDCPADINYIIAGTAPCRTFTVNFTTVPQYSCNELETTQQIVLYETTNVIEVYIQDKPTCSNWNSGNAIIGIQDATGANGITPPGRNTGPWSASNEAWRFTPDGTPNYVVSWYDGGNLVGTGLTLNVCPSTTTTYEAEVVYTNCDASTVTVTDQVTVTQNSTVSVSVSPTTVDLCAGESATLTASSPNAGMSYTWSPTAGLSATTGTTVTATPTTTTVYTVTGNDGTCSASANVNVNVVDIQLITSSTDASCAGNDGTATVTASGGVLPYTFAWNTTPVQTLQTAVGLAVGNYNVVVTDATGCTATAVVTVTLTLGTLSSPTMTFTNAVCTALNGTATATPVDGNPPFTFSWDTNPVQTTQTITDLGANIYTVTLTDAGGCTSTASVTVGTDPGNLAATINTFSDASCYQYCDGTATVDVVNGTATINYLWDDPTNQTTQTASGLCAGTYNVGIVDANGCVSTAQVLVSEPSEITANAVMDLQSNCGMPDGQASVTANGGTVANDYSYAWATVPVQTTAVATGLLPAFYTVTISDDNGCTATANTVVTSTPGFSVSIPTFTDATCNQGCDGTADLIVGNGAVLPTTYLWSNGQTTTTADLLCAGDHSVTVTDNAGCEATASVTISEPTVVTTQPTVGTTPICIGQSSDLTSGASGGTPPYTTYQWTAVPADGSLTDVQNPTVSPIVSTVYSVVATDANGCVSAVKSVSVDVLPPLSLSVIRPTTVDTGICPYDSATIDLVAMGGDGNFSYHLLPDTVTPIALPMVVQPAATTAYNFSVSDGCTTPPALATGIITIFLLPPVDFIGDELTGCDPHTVAFTDLTVPTPVAWDWNFGDTLSVSNTAPQQHPNHLFSDSGFYDVSLSVISADGCVNDTEKEEYIQVYPLPNANFGADPKRTTILNEITFSDLSTGEIDTWDWDFGTGDGSEEQHPIYLYTDTGTYVVQLEVMTVDGCEDTATSKIIIDPEFTFYVPNSFTPNNDGKNEGFRAYGEGVEWSTYEMFIFDRWGERIFYTADIETPWTGWYKNKDVEAGVYVWSIQLVDLLGQRHSLQGHVTLLR